jgi:hypothetical protein
MSVVCSDILRDPQIRRVMALEKEKSACSRGAREAFEPSRRGWGAMTRLYDWEINEKEGGREKTDKGR